jgi:hypothetical protein
MSNIANAQCAWVLWKSSKFISNLQEVSWELISAVPTHGQCLEMKEVLFEQEKIAYKKLKTDMPDLKIEMILVKPEIPDHISVVFQDRVQWLDYQCLPDTIDPRK